MFLFLSLLLYFFLIRLAAFFTAINSLWVIDFLDILIVLILLLPKASWALVEDVITRPERIVVASSSTIASAIPSWSSKRLVEMTVQCELGMTVQRSRGMGCLAIYIGGCRVRARDIDSPVPSGPVSLLRRRIVRLIIRQ